MLNQRITNPVTICWNGMCECQLIFYLWNNSLWRSVIFYSTHFPELSIFPRYEKEVLDIINKSVLTECGDEPLSRDLGTPLGDLFFQTVQSNIQKQYLHFVPITVLWGRSGSPVMPSVVNGYVGICPLIFPVLLQQTHHCITLSQMCWEVWLAVSLRFEVAYNL